MKRFLLIFFIIFTLFFSVSFAYEFGSTQMTQAGYYGQVNNTTQVGDYTLAELKTLMTNYNNGNISFSDLEPVINYYYNIGYNVIIANSWANSSNMKTIGIIPKNVDVMSFGNPGYGFMFSSIDDNTYEGYIVSLATSWSKSYIIRTVYNGYKGNTAGDLYGNGIEFATCDIKQATNTSQSWYWDGFSYLYESSYGSSNSPSIDYDLAGIIDVIKNSAEIQDNLYSHLGDYFIVPNGTFNDEQIFSIYFYHKSVNLSQFEYLFNDVLYYDLDKTSVDGIIYNLIDHMNGFDKVIKDVQLFTLYYNPETSTGDIYLTSNRSINELKSFVSETQPIIYTTKNIAYYSATWGETDTEWTATADSSKDILHVEIQDDEGNVISPIIPDTSTSLAETPWDRFISAIKSIPSTLLEGIKAIFVPDFSNSLDFFEKLKSKFNFLFEVKDLVSGMFDKLVYQTEPPSITVDLTTSNSKYNWGSNAIALDMSWYEPYKPTVDIFICAFCYGIFFWNLFRKLANIVSGVSGEGAQSSKEGSK